MLERLANKISLRHQISLVTGAVGLTIVAAVTLGSALLARAPGHRHGRERAAAGRTLRCRSSGPGHGGTPARDPQRGPRSIRCSLTGWRIPGVSATSCNRCRRPSRIMPGSALRTRPEKVRAATGGILEGANVGQRPWFIDGIKGAAAEDVHLAALLQTLLRPNADGTPFRFVDLASPVHRRIGPDHRRPGKPSQLELGRRSAPGGPVLPPPPN